MKLSEIKQVLAERNIRLTKSLGQNFLHDGNQLRRIADAAELQPSDKVLEIGPGLGPLTQRLLSAADEVLAIEKDRRLVDFLQHRFGDANGLTVVHDDALDFLRREKRDWSDGSSASVVPVSLLAPAIDNDELERTKQCRHRSRGCSQQAAPTPIF